MDTVPKVAKVAGPGNEPTHAYISKVAHCEHKYEQAMCKDVY